MAVELHAQSPQRTAADKNKRSRPRKRTILLLLLLFYLLSTGPAHRLVLRHWLPEPALAIYAPLRVLGRIFSPANLALRWYVHDVWRCWWDD